LISGLAGAVGGDDSKFHCGGWVLISGLLVVIIASSTINL